MGYNGEACEVALVFGFWGVGVWGYWRHRGFRRRCFDRLGPLPISAYKLSAASARRRYLMQSQTAARAVVVSCV